MFLDRYLFQGNDLTDFDGEEKSDFKEKELQGNSKLKNTCTNKLAGRGNIWGIPSILCKANDHFSRDLFSACMLQLEIPYILKNLLLLRCTVKQSINFCALVQPVFGKNEINKNLS